MAPSLRLRSAGSLVIKALLLLGVCRAQAALVTAGNGMDSKPVRNVCLVYYEAIVFCDPNKPPSAYTGYEVELFRKVAEWVTKQGYNQWNPANYTFTCMGFDELMDDLLLPVGQRTCDVGVAGISATSERMAKGYEFTAPTYDSGRQILIYAPSEIDMFLFLKPFDQAVWLTVMATTVFVGIAVFFAEVPMRRIIRSPEPALQKYLNLQWASIAMLLQAMQQFSARSVSSRLIILGYAFMVVILINAYIAVLSSQLTVNSINLNVRGLTDLINKPVGIFEADVNALKQFNLQGMVPLPWNNAEDEANMLTMLRSGQISALILDKPFTDYQAAISCDLYTVGDVILPNSLAFAFPPETNLSYVALFSQGLIIMQENGVMTDLITTYIKPSGSCPSKNGANLANSQITLPQIAGLWVFLACSVAAGYSWNLLVYLWGKYKAWEWGEDDDNTHAPRSGSINENQVAPNEGNTADGRKGSIKRSMSLLQNNPDQAWMSVADASTAEEGLIMLEAHVKLMDKRIKNLTSIVESRFNLLMDAFEASRPDFFRGAEEKLDPGKEPLPGLNRPRSNRGTKTTSFQGVDGVVAKVAYNGNDNDATIPLSPRTGRAVSFSADVAPAIVPALSQLERMEQGQAQSVTSPRGGALSRPGAIPAVSNTDQDAVITL